jgi:polysaccharide deacetylase 2 family uncharacterized protein YibQ
MVVRKKGNTRGKAAASPKKTSAKKAPGKKKGIKKKLKPNLGKELKKILLGVVILLAVCLTLAMIIDIFMSQGKRDPGLESPKSGISKTEKPKFPGDKKHISPVFEDPTGMFNDDTLNKKPYTGLRAKSQRPIIYEIFEDLDHGGLEKKPSLPTGGKDIPRIAIIIDDIGYDKKIAMDLYHLNSDLTFSVLPFSPFGSSIAKTLSAKGAQLMLHLPMEPVQYPKANPGPGALFLSMTPDTLLEQLRKDLKQVPGIVGVNNHMGSKVTADSDKMNQVFTVLKNENLFFIDSRTSSVSKGEASARLFNLRFAQRDIFLDNSQNIPYITGQLRELIRIAKKHGTAIGIGHPYKATLETLKIELPKLAGKIHIVPASQLVAFLE